MGGHCGVDTAGESDDDALTCVRSSIQVHEILLEAADLIIKGVGGAIEAKTVTYDLDRHMDGATELSCSAFGDAVIGKM